MLDLPNYSVLIGGLDYWFPLGDEIAEPRLAAKLCGLLGVVTLQLRLPPADPEDLTAPPTGINAWQFPEWFITQDVHLGETQSYVRSRMLVHRTALTRGKFIDQDRNGARWYPCVSSVCRADIEDPTGTPTLRANTVPPAPVDRRAGTSGDLAEVSVRCECGQQRRWPGCHRIQPGASVTMGHDPGSGRTQRTMR
jgi:hypothetical protein